MVTYSCTFPPDPGERALRAHLQEWDQLGDCEHGKAPGGGVEK